ncbi:MAG: phosphoribosylanthranilate isomerase [Pseudomonadota bacterium]
MTKGTLRPRIKVCCISSVEEARLAAAAGADLIGLVGPMPSGPGVLTLDECRQIAQAAPAWVTPVLLTSSETADDIAEDVRTCGVRAVQIVRHVEPEVHRRLAEMLPSVRRLQVIHVEDRKAVASIERYGMLPDAYLLDSGKPSSDQLGGTGRVHDWEVSAAFVRHAPRPVFLAGGLNPLNAGEALATVKPFGLDICSGIRVDDILNRQKLDGFMAATRTAMLP